MKTLAGMMHVTAAMGPLPASGEFLPPRLAPTEPTLLVVGILGVAVIVGGLGLLLWLGTRRPGEH
ncbi:hypothetical protein HS125_08925 [bacterium]|nr:hypothetical protein [bacterium]